MYAADADTVPTIDYRKYIPNIHGVMRARFERETSGEKEGRFVVANARLNFSGNVTDFASYFFQVDFCDRGAIKILDAYATLKSKTGLKFMFGQMRVPFSVEASKVVENYLFTNRTFLIRYIGNYRAVGAKLGWNAKFAPLYVEGGVFNSSAMANHEVWHKAYVYAVKSRYSFENCFVEGAFESRCPEHVRINMTDAAFVWNSRHWTAETEYTYKHYTNKAFPACHAYNVMLNYRKDISTEWFNQLSFQSRFDGMNQHSTGKKVNEILIADAPECHRITGGITLSQIKKKSGLDLRVNYAHHFYSRSHILQEGEGNTVSAELILWF